MVFASANDYAAPDDSGSAAAAVVTCEETSPQTNLLLNSARSGPEVVTLAFP